MKKYLLLLLLSFPIMLGAQCIIDFNQTQPGIYPDTMPVGYVNQAYNEDITFVLPLDTMGFDFTNFEIVSISLPVGLSWQCNNSANGCNYNPQVNQYGCVNVYGTPLLAGQYQVDVAVLADLTVAQGIPTTFSVFMEILPNNVPVSNNGFSMLGASGCAPQTVSFTNNNPGLLGYSWDFGNGNLSTLENPSPQIYSTPGAYAVNYEAWAVLDTIDLYTLTGVTINSMSGYGGGFPSYDDADSYYILFENGAVYSQSGIIANTNPPVSWTTNVILNPANTYTIEIWESDAGEILFGADDYIGIHTLNLAGCNGCAAGSSNINYSIAYQQILPSPAVISVDTVYVSGYPSVPSIAFDSLSSTLSTTAVGASLQWYVNGGSISGATNPTHNVTMSGNYHVISINANGCVSYSDTILAVFCSPTFLPLVDLNAAGNLIVSNAGNFDVQWYVNNSILVADTFEIAIPLVPGDYTVVLTDEFGCEYTSAPMGVNVGIAEETAFSWRIYPNPANDFVFIDVQGTEVDRIEVVDLSGRVMISLEEVNEVKNKLNLQGLSSGTYMVRLVQAGRVASQTMIVQK